MKNQDNLVHPEDSGNFSYWSKKLGVSVRELNDAILYTGSLNPVCLKKYLRKDLWYSSPFLGVLDLFKNKNLNIH